MSTTALMVKLLDESRFKVTLYIANIFKLTKCERVRKRGRNQNYCGVLLHLGHFEPAVCFILFWVIFFMMIQVQNQYTDFHKFVISKSNFFFINCFFTNQTNYYQMSCLTNFYEMFLDQSNLIESHLNI